MVYRHVTPATPLPQPRAGDQRTPVWIGAPAVRMRVESRWLGVSPDGDARILVFAQLFDANGKATTLIKGGDFDFTTSAGQIAWQTRSRFSGPAAILRTNEARTIIVHVRANVPKVLGVASIIVDTRRTGVAPVAAALGPHTVQVGWFPRERTSAVEIVRSEGAASTIVGVVAPPSSTYSDTSAMPEHSYRYTIRQRGRVRSERVPVVMPAEVSGQSLDAMRGKGMWLSFSPHPSDENWFGRWDVPRMLDLASAAGLHHIELRVAYGEYHLISPRARATIDALIDGCASRGIALVAWTVPREASFEDIAQSVASAAYRTPGGHQFAAIAIDLERGAEFMGSGAAARAALGDYARRVRSALGPRAIIVATLEDPSLSHIGEAQIPFRAIAANVDALEPMVYWRAMAPTTPPERVIRASLATLARLAGRTIPMSVGGQSAALPHGGAPAPEDIVASLRASQANGAIGETLFDWDGTAPGQWDALATYRW